MSDEKLKAPDFLRKFFASIFKEYLLKNSTKGNANEFVDRLLEKTRRHFTKYYDPLRRKNFSPEINRIFLRGLSTLKRTGPATVRNVNGYLLLDLFLGFDKLLSEIEIEKKALLFKIAGLVDYEIRKCNIFCRLGAVSRYNGLKFKLERLKVVDWGKMTVFFSGTNLLGVLLASLSYLFPSLIRLFVKSQLRKWFFNFVQDYLANISFSNWIDFNWSNPSLKELVKKVYGK